MKMGTIDKVLDYAYLADDAVRMTGVTGIGKTEITEEWAKNKNIHMEVLYLSSQEVGDLIGNPKTVQHNNESITTWTVPSWLQKMNDASWPTVSIDELEFSDNKLKEYITDNIQETSKITRIELTRLFNSFYNTEEGLLKGQTKIKNKKSKYTALFLDEFSRAPLDVRQSSLQLILARKIHQHELPITQGKRTFLVAADNPDDGDYQVESLDPAVDDRFLDLPVEVDTQAWLDWARENKVNKVVRAFIADNPSKLHFQPEEGGEDTKYATPRSWTKLAKYVDNFDNTPHEIHYNIIIGKVGKAVGMQFLNFYNNFKSIVSVEDIETLVKSLPNNISIEKKGEAVKALIDDTEVTQQTEMVKSLIDKYKDSQPNTLGSDILLSYLHALNIEIVSSVLKNIANNDTETYFKIVELERVVNNKGLFVKITQNLVR